jgi:galactokinase
VDGLVDLGLGADRLAALAQHAENDFVSAPTGVMDQIASLHGREGHALLVDTRSLSVEPIPLDAASDGLTLVAVDTRVNHALGDGSYADRRSACERAASALGVTALRDVPVEGLADRLATLDDELRRRARHVVTEDARVLAAVGALRSGDWVELGRLMTASHVSLRDDYEVSCAELDVAVECALSARAVGARMTGGGFGGSAIALVPAGQVGALTRAVTDRFAAHGWDRPTVFPVVPSPGARRET